MQIIKNKIDDYFKDYNREAWLKIRKARYKQIRDNNFYLNTDAETFKKEILRFCEGDQVEGFSFRNSNIRKRSGGWIPFQDNNGQTVNGGEIMRELEADNLELHGNYSWSMMYRGGDITVDMQKLKNTLDYLFDESIAIEKRFFEVVNINGNYKIEGMGYGKASAFLHIKYPNKYGVWNSCTNGAFRILGVEINGENEGERYKNVNELLNELLVKNKKSEQNLNGFENLSDVDIFVWYVANNLI